MSPAPARRKANALAPACATLALALSGCSSLPSALDTRPNSGPCPVSASLYEASRIVEFNGDTTRYDSISWTGEITDVRIACRYVDDNPIVATIDIDFAFGKGPAAAGNSHEYGYFVTVTRRNRSVLEKETFMVRADFRGGDSVVGQTVTIPRIEIPRYDDSISGANFEILIGFELTPEQLAFNRDGRRYRLDASE